MNGIYKILVVDDDEVFRKLMNRQLTNIGYDCTTVDSGEKALRVLGVEDFDVVLIDIAMPHMDGLTLLRAMRVLDSDAVPVVLSGRQHISVVVEAMNCGAFDYIEKVSDVMVLRNAVERAVIHRRMRRRAKRMSDTAKQWEATFDAVPDLIAIIDTNYRFVRVNKAMAEKLGCTAQEAVGRKCYELAHRADAPHERCPYTRLLKDNREHIASIKEECFEGYFLISTSPLYGAEGELIGCVNVARDITQEKAVEEKLRTANMETERLVSSMSSFLIEVDTELRIRRWNAAAERTFGISSDGVLGKPIADSGIQWDWSHISGDLHKWLTVTERYGFPTHVIKIRTALKEFLESP